MTQATAVVFGVGDVNGVGGAACLRFAREGYHVLVAGRTPAKIEKVVEAVREAGKGSAEAVPTDVTDEAQVIAAFDRAMNPGQGRAPADVVISNAGNNVDGGIDGARLRGVLPQMVERLGPEGLLDPQAIVENYWMLHQQPRSAWSHEIDLRPFKENW